MKELGKGAQREGVRSPRLCGDAVACAPIDERAEAGNALGGAAEVEAACSVETAADKATARPRFRKRTWGTLRVVLVCECARDSRLEVDPWAPGPPSMTLSALSRDTSGLRAARVRFSLHL